MNTNNGVKQQKIKTQINAEQAKKPAVDNTGKKKRN
jgi:hypothetical protein